MRPDSAAQCLIEALEHVDTQSFNDYDILIEAASEVIRVSNLASSEIIEDIFIPAWGDYSFDGLAELANDPRVSVETELYKQVQQLFEDIRANKADLPAFFYNVLGRNL